MKVKCINDRVDGLTKGVTYEVSDIFIRNRVCLYGMRDDYAVYNEFSADKFNLLNMFEFSMPYEGVNINIRLK